MDKDLEKKVPIRKKGQEALVIEIVITLHP